ncbi:hypothetical protein GJ744_003053 [Endocarpon pusillum]|uniref:Uncharacterized protein n=1 Tax=Endocarpon pusillum TaxID=364733 RepID=A0A8H7AB39_9EURO|nr:hypothetical protein GJ744_003053 [Endocarpon pusillum]
MPLHADDRLLCIVLASGLLVAANAIPYYLKYIRTITQVNHEDKPSKGPCEDAEDALKLDTLKKLVAAPSYKLRASAVKIIAERSIKDATRKLLLRDLASKHSTKRDQALHALWFLLSDSSLIASLEIKQHFMSDPSTFTAIVDCLSNLLPLHSHGPPEQAHNPTRSSPLLPHNRPPSETLALHILRELLTDQTLPTALSAGLISKWLKHYPFPCALPSNGARRQEVIKLFKTKSFGPDDPFMAAIITIIIRQPEGLKQLRKHGLTGSSYGEAAEVDIEDVFMADGEDTAGVVPSSVTMPPAAAAAARPASWRRPPDPSNNQAERAVRQRRREAAVYSEGDAPLTQDNIFQRQPSNVGLGAASASASASAVGAAPDATDTAIEARQARMDEEEEREEELLALALQEVRNMNSRVQQQSSARHSSNVWQWLTMNLGRV